MYIHCILERVRTDSGIIANTVSNNSVNIEGFNFIKMYEHFPSSRCMPLDLFVVKRKN